MTVFLAFHQHGRSNEDSLRAATDRVTRWYSPADGMKVERVGNHTTGLIKWSSHDDENWWQWASDDRGATALPFPPILPFSTGSNQEVRQQAIHSVSECTPPFAVLQYRRKRDELSLQTDALGIGKIFFLQTEQGVFFSNRPVAMLLFSGTKPQRSHTGWLYMAGIGWCMDSSTLYEGITVLPPASHWRVSRKGKIERSSQRTLLENTKQIPSVGETMEALKGTVAATNRYLPNPYVDLSGGRDSRLVTAAFLACGLPFRSNTNDRKPGEVEVAQQLLTELSNPPAHRVQHIVNNSDQLGHLSAIEQAIAWHNWSEGSRPESYLWGGVPTGDLTLESPQKVGGAAGGIAQGVYYTPGVRRRIEQTQDTVPRSQLVRILGRNLLRPRPEASKTAKEQARIQIRMTLLEGEGQGLSGFTLLDYFCLHERVRRWAMSDEVSSLSPLQTPGFMRHALLMPPKDRVSTALHQELIATMVPQWADVPFLSALKSQPMPILRMAHSQDSQKVAEIVTADSSWHQLYDREVVQSAWDASNQEISSSRQERQLRSVIWLVAFEMHLDDIRVALES